MISYLITCRLVAQRPSANTNIILKSTVLKAETDIISSVAASLILLLEHILSESWQKQQQNTKAPIKNRKWKKRQYNGRKNKGSQTLHRKHNWETRNPLKSEDELRYFMNFTSLMGQELIFDKRIIIFRIMKAFCLCFLLQLSSIVVLNLHRESQGHKVKI